MKTNYLLTGGVFFLICSCNWNKSESSRTDVATDSTFTNDVVESQENEENENLDSIKQVILKIKSSGDTLKYQFSIEDVGTEGNEGTAYYIDNKLQKVDFDIYTSMWKIHLLYLLNKNNIQVTEETFNIYENIKRVKQLSYLINLDGVPLGKVDSSRVDIFQDIKDAVPFELK